MSSVRVLLLAALVALLALTLVVASPAADETQMSLEEAELDQPLEAAFDEEAALLEMEAEADPAKPATSAPAPATKPSAPAVSAAPQQLSDIDHLKAVSASEAALAAAQKMADDAAKELKRVTGRLSASRSRAQKHAAHAERIALRLKKKAKEIRMRLGKNLQALVDREKKILETDNTSRARRKARRERHAKIDAPLRQRAIELKRKLAVLQGKARAAHHKWQDQKLLRKEQHERRKARRAARLVRRAAELKAIRRKLKHLRNQVKAARRKARKAGDKAARLRSLTSKEAKKKWLLRRDQQRIQDAADKAAEAAEAAQAKAAAKEAGL